MTTLQGTSIAHGSKICLGRWLRLAVALVCGVRWLAHGQTPLPNERLRYMVETDAGGDPDYEQSLVRFLLYVNEWDVEGLIANRPTARERENLNPERTGLGIVRAMVKAYGHCHPNLVLHDPRYPKPEQLLQRTVSGTEETDDGVNLIIAAVGRDDPRPLWYSNWGTDRGSAPSCLKRALDRVLRERGQAGYARFKDKLRLTGDDQFGEHTSALAPPWRLWVDTLRPELDRQRWYHRFSALTAKAGGFDVERDVRTGHGPLGALYPTNTTHPQKEGDTLMFLYLVPTGLNDPNQPAWGSWAGRYGRRDGAPGRAYYWANQSDEWQGTSHRENTLKRWAVHLQNDFKARMDWCAADDFKKANHNPAAILNGDRSKKVLEVTAKPGETVRLSAEGSSDPDGNRITARWWIYREAGSFRGEVKLTSETGLSTRLVAPEVARAETIHAILELRDDGTPNLFACRRLIVNVQPPTSRN